MKRAALKKSEVKRAAKQASTRRPARGSMPAKGRNPKRNDNGRIVTPSQTVGPFFAVGFGAVPPLANGNISGDRITITGRMLDGSGTPIPDGLLETWQANSRGKYAHPEDWQDKQVTPGFTGYGRILTAKDGTFRIETIRPGSVPWPGLDPRKGTQAAQQAPHIVVAVFARGMLKHLFTRIYFSDDPLVSKDPVLQLVKDSTRRTTLLAKPEQPGQYRWNLVLQGPGETVFFDV